MKSYLTKQLIKVRNKSKIYFSSLALFLTGVSAHIVYAADPFEKSKNLAQQGITKIQGISIFLFGLGLVVTGLVYSLGGREIKAAIKKHWLAIAIGIIVVSTGPSIVEWFYNFVKS
ncbi:TrbC/VirB2 family protein [Streptococcus anginosus]|uniref:TrbC/VirB2 family protein n=1 Tax=Streptococcus anginosus TaxID=1328 RepID=UPI0021F861A7|nr:TrbC/VirB2 family protein [Streptococcus anginosus]MCW1017524.1 TrbC/VirB2 family protein [Streptococcus anginosus]